MSRVVLHTCCGPCASACVPRLKADNHEVVMYFANSNIDTREEYEKRLAEARKLAAVEGVRLEAEPYDHDEWLREVAAGYENEPEKGARCARCFRYNLAKAASFAEREGIAGYTTSLTVSPHKVTSVVFASVPRCVPACGVDRDILERTAGETHCGTEFLPYDFKKKGGFLESTRRAKELGLYRQGYCGCEFSKRMIPK